MSESNLAIGIDLGTTYSCVGIFKNGKVEIISNDCGERTTPSVVAFSNGERLVGTSALSQINTNPFNTVFDAKRLIGRKFNEKTVQEDMKHWPFTVKQAGERCEIVVTHNDQKKSFSPEQISGMVLEKMKNIAETYLGHKVKKAVVTVPAYFNDDQRRSTMDAGICSDMDIIRIINEPTAAALAYGLDKTDQRSSYILVFDLGGGTFDVSILLLEEGVFEVKATCGDSHLGGEDFDNLMVDHCVAEFMKKNPDFDKSDVKAMRRLRTACEKQKRSLSSSTSATISVENFFKGKDLFIVVSRATFEKMCESLFKKTITEVAKCLEEAGLSKSDIGHCVLVGGSTRIPKVQSMLASYFDGKELNKSVHPDEAVAIGAAIQAAVLTGSDTTGALNDVLLLDVTALDYGIMTKGEVMTVIIKRGTTIPTKASQVFTTAASNQTSVQIRIYQGNRPMVSGNLLLGEFSLDEIPPAPSGVPQIEVTLDVDANGVLNVTAMDMKTKKKSHISITNQHRLSKDEIEKMKSEAEKFRGEDEVRAEFVHALNDLESLANSVTSTMRGEEYAKALSESEKKKITDMTNEIDSWISSEARSMDPAQAKAKAEAKKKALEDLWYPLSSKVGGGQGPQAGQGFPEGAAGAAGSSSSAGPTIEEVD